MSLTVMTTNRHVPLFMPRLDLGISRRKATIPALDSQRRARSITDVTPGDAKIKSWHDEYYRIRLLTPLPAMC
jgi:hypothetical protein